MSFYLDIHQIAQEIATVNNTNLHKVKMYLLEVCGCVDTAFVNFPSAVKCNSFIRNIPALLLNFKLIITYPGIDDLLVN